MEKLKHGMESWGHYLLAVLCAGVILLSAAWTRDQQALDRAEQAALSGRDQNLAEAQAEAGQAFCRPAPGPVTAPYADAPVFNEETGVWQAHPFVDFALAPGDAVFALLSGTVVSESAGTLLIDRGDGVSARYQGPFAVSVRAGQAVRAGDKLGFCSAAAESALRVSVTENGQYRAFGEEWE